MVDYSLFIVAPIVSELCLFCYAVLCVFSSFAIVLRSKKELVSRF